MAAPRKYPDEVRERAIRLVQDLVDSGEDGVTVTGACRRVVEQLGINTDTLRNWVKPALVDDGEQPGLSTSERVRPVPDVAVCVAQARGVPPNWSTQGTRPARSLGPLSSEKDLGCPRWQVFLDLGVVVGQDAPDVGVGLGSLVLCITGGNQIKQEQ
jgi:transposase-like protein